MRRQLVRAASAALLTMLAAPALAADQALGGDRDRFPTEITRRPLTLPQGMIEVWAPVQLNASEDADWKPVTLNPSLNFGITDRWQIGLRHIVGICLGETEDGCAKVYDDVGVTTRLSLGRGGGLDLALQGALQVAPISDPQAWSGEVGLLVRAGGGAVAITAAPTLSFGLNDRDLRGSRLTPITWNLGTYDVVQRSSPGAETAPGPGDPTGTIGNKEHIAVPVTLQIQLGKALALFGGASVEGPLNPEVGDFSDYWRIPVGAGAVFTASPNFDVGAALTFPLFAGENDTRDIRILSAFLAFRI
jgi:hypothetical protein